MAKSHRAAPGTYTTNGVRCTMQPPFAKAARSREGSGGTHGHNRAPFDQPQSTGNGGVPTKFYDGTRSTSATRVPASGMVANSSLGTIKTSRRK